MPLKKGLSIIFALIFSGCFFSKLIAQDLNSTFRLARHHQEMGQYDAAMLHYQRVLYFTEGDHRIASYMGVANCYAHQGDNLSSQKFYDLAFQNAHSDSLANEIMFKKAAASILNHKYNQAMLDLYNIYPLNEEEAKRLDFYFAISYYGLNEFDSAQARFNKTIPVDDYEAKNKIDSLFKLNEKYHRLNPKTARIMSMIIPGSGQLYAGNVKAAINSMAITFGFGYLTLNTTIQISFIDAFVSVFPWFFRYYMGGYNNAEQVAEEKIQKREVQIYRGLLDVISESKSGSNN